MAPTIRAPCIPKDPGTRDTAAAARHSTPGQPAPRARTSAAPPRSPAAPSPQRPTRRAARPAPTGPGTYQNDQCRAVRRAAAGVETRFAQLRALKEVQQRLALAPARLCSPVHAALAHVEKLHNVRAAPATAVATRTPLCRLEHAIMRSMKLPNSRPSLRSTPSVSASD
ncbi:hypothetical protein MY11210_005650 [Beauveria gryllotalpidicola]